MNQGKSVIHLLAARLGIYLLSVAVTYTLASVIATQSVVSSLGRMGVDVGIAERLSMTLQDLAGMASLFLPMVAFALLCAFMAAALLCRWLGRWRVPLYMLAAAVGILAIHLTLNYAFGITPIAVARTTGGLALQALAGAVGGWLYISLRHRQAAGTAGGGKA